MESSIWHEFDPQAVFEVDDYLYFYSEMLTDELTNRQVAFIREVLDLNSPKRILDLACGFGRHANRLAKLGHEITGIDLMPGFLEIARSQADELGVSVDYQQGDMRHLDRQEAYDCVLMLFTVFGYFEDEENLCVMKNVSQALKQGGLLLLDVPNRDVLMKNSLPFVVREKGRDLMIDRNEFDTVAGRMYNHRIVIRDGVRKDKSYSVRMYNPSEIKSMVDKAGMQLRQLFGDWDGSPVSAQSRRMIVVAQKQ